MALFIAKTPQYRSREKVPSKIGVRYSDLRASRAENEAISRLGNLLQVRAEEMKKEHDTAVVGELYNKWRDADRQALSELFKRKGKDAVNLGQEYDKFFTKSQGEADKEAENGSQQAQINNMLSRRREQSLDVLARYEVTEGERYKAAQAKGVFDNAVESAREGAGNEDIILGAIAEVRTFIDSTYQGMGADEKEALFRSHEAAIRFASYQAQTDSDPDGVLVNIEKYKDVLGEGYETLKNKAEKKSEEKIVEGLRNALNEKYTEGTVPNFNKMEDAIQQDKTIPENIKDQVVVWIRSQEREYKAREAKAKADAQDFEMDTIFKFLRSGNIVDAYKAVLDATQLSEVQKYRIEKIIKDSTEKKGETDKQLYNDVIKKAMRLEITRDQIIDLIGNGLSVSDSRTALTELKAAEAPGMEELNDSKAKAIDSVEKQIVRGSQMVGYNQKSVDNSYKAVKELEKTMANPTENATVEDLLDPESKYYVLDKIIKKYTLSPLEQVESISEAYSTSSDTRKKPGESIEDWEKRQK